LTAEDSHLVPGKVQDIFVISQVPSLALGPTWPPHHWLPGTFSAQEVKWLGCEVGHWSSAEFRECISAPAHLEASTRTTLLCKLELSDQKTTV